MNLGILIIGSLYWDTDPTRVHWRSTLDMTDARHVTAPIRYGRKSSSRGNTYTMVFSQLCAAPDKLGTGIVVRALRDCRNGNDLIAEAQRLWAAERKAHELGATCAGWGRVCLLKHPDFKMADPVLDKWRAASSPCHLPLSTATDEDPVVDHDSGLALIDWPNDVSTGEPLADYDVLLMTATEPTLTNRSYPTPETIAEAWRRNPHYLHYFHENRACGITTFEDQELVSLL